MGRPQGMPLRSTFADRAHGTRLRYVSGCKCVPCRAANSRYETERSAARKRGDFNGFVDAAKTREHLRRLSRQGVGYKSAAAAADVSKTVLAKVLNGKRTQVRARTERRVLEVTREAIADHALVRAGRTQQQLATLLDEGFTKTELARRLGSRSRTPALRLGRTRVTAKSASKVERLYRMVMAEAEA